MLSSFRRVLVIAPHTDDGELGAGGTISQLASSGAKIVYFAFSACEESVPKEFPPTILRQEVLAATSILGVSNNDVYIKNYSVRKFSEKRQEILDDLICLRQEVKPDLILQPSINDVHQDHSVVAYEARRAFKNHTALAYELPWNNFGTDCNCFVALDHVDLNKKIAAIAAYKSQSGRTYSKPEVLMAWATSRGLQSGNSFAEAFEVIRWHIG